MQKYLIFRDKVPLNEHEVRVLTQKGLISRCECDENKISSTEYHPTFKAQQLYGLNSQDLLVGILSNLKPRFPSK